MKRFLAWFAAFVRTSVQAVSRVDFYRRIGERRPADAIGHMAVLILILWVIPISIMFFIATRAGLDAFLGALRTRVPPGTVFELKDGKLSNNLASPLVFREDGAVFIVNTATSTLTLEEGERGVVIDSEEVVQQDGPHRESWSFHDAPNFKSSREDIDAWVTRYAALVIFLAAFLALISAFFGLTIGYGLMAALYGLVLWLAFKLLKQPRPYAQTFTAAAYAATAPIAAKAAFAAVGLNAGIVPIALYWILLGVMLYDAAKSSRKEADHEKKKD